MQNWFPLTAISDSLGGNHSRKTSPASQLAVAFRCPSPDATRIRHAASNMAASTLLAEDDKFAAQ